MRNYQIWLESLDGQSGQVCTLSFNTIEEAWRQAKIEEKGWNEFYRNMEMKQRVKIKQVCSE